MGQRSNDVAVKDVQIKLRKEVCVRVMGQSQNDAAVIEAQIKFIVEECHSSMGQTSSCVAVKDVQIKPYVKEYVGGTAHIAIHTTVAKEIILLRYYG